jgi:4-hydroxy-tetrahydrodipicolinate reductase
MKAPLKIALMGYGRMGREIEKICQDRGHQVVLKIDSNNAASVTDNDIKNCNVVIEFTQPQSVLKNIQRCLDIQIPVVVGTTGWYDSLKSVKDQCEKKDGTMLYASNFSIGVNILFEMNSRLAALMNNRPEYKVDIEEVHHLNKLDKPSGTGITLAEGIIRELDRKKRWITDEETATDSDLVIHSQREPEVVGKHSVRYSSEIDEMVIMHNAFSRKGFAEGAVLAAEFIVGKKGMFTMQDVLK